MRIGIDGRMLTGRFTGERTYWHNLLLALAALDSSDQYTVYTRIPAPVGALPPFANLAFKTLPAAKDRPWSAFILPRAVRKDRIDVLHAQDTMPLLCHCPVVFTVHDISFRLNPKWYRWIDRVLLNTTMPFAIRAAARVITVSESSRCDIIRLYGLQPNKVVATPLGLPDRFLASESLAAPEVAREQAIQFVRDRWSIDKPFVLAVGVLQPRKNLGMLAHAFGIARKRYGLPHSLVLAGKAGWSDEQARLRFEANRGGGQEAADALIFPGYIEDEDLPPLYRAAELFAYPSLYEGFGLPPLESMASGTPVVVSDRPAMPEIVGSAAAVVAASDPEAWAKTLGELLTNPDKRRDLAARGAERVMKYRWADTARRTRAVYDDVVDQRRSRG